MKNIIRKTIAIDATDQSPGRLASKVAHILIGKHKTDFAPQSDVGDCVSVTNASKMHMEAKKAAKKIYRKHLMRPRGLREVSMKAVIAKNPANVLERAVSNMLPKNSHRTPRLKRLKISN